MAMFLRTKLVAWAVMIMFCFMIYEEASEGGCRIGGCIYGKPTASSDYVFPTRKVLPEPKSRRSHIGSESATIRELRRVPSGPDPLHHNGATPNKPRATP